MQNHVIIFLSLSHNEDNFFSLDYFEFSHFY